ncbi:D-alanyl-D-alanine carboxypeptidase / D-alanyl-D-alanine-endopeptidase (penicillin-binding protein 4) [Mitsuaria sp. PDC51]|uniref:D-alanyl-D-alanine carboxypeptidase/D-alanyl-D-alanine endopeptidase n=1 Tax=Mitsuaria sp. PDC51 TaxID=1881035 RepID=UPI0008E22D4F|nr:D-alanyl-D-alanine carboxypeptidase/D-alanyl-D-alanine-endopeptidase [Mitsuaria sp. PDC51]SFR93267.1 D-alanyl-D-alanine carboxypeptidase / D-alanyl-D-alanine-endopeptidase (penicillin-binding protein 4) [Mitsuaria sp. PDC51]
MRSITAFALLVAALATTGCATLIDTPPAPVQAALREAGVPAASLAVVAHPLEAPGTGLRLNADRPMAPASTMKTITAVVALDRLGPGSRGQTQLLAAGEVRDGRLDGPLVLKGGADADLDWPALWAMLRELRERHGVRELAGGIVVDRGLFNPSRLDIDAPRFDEQAEFPYNVIPDALHLNGSLLQYDLAADERGLTVRPFPQFGALVIDTSAVRLNDKPCKDWDDGWMPSRFEPLPGGGGRLVLAGEFPRGCQVTQSLNVLDRQWETAQALRQLWGELGGSLSGEIREGATPEGARVLVQHRDRPLAELLRPVMKASDNALARLLFLRLGAAAAQPGEDTRQAAARVVRDWFAAQRIDTTGMTLENGSGLSRTERATAAQLAAMLGASARGPHGPELLATLPVAGVDGTLARRMKGTAAEGRARMKTGTLRDVVALAGYVPDSTGRTWIVVAIVNDEQAMKARPAIDALVDWVARQ